VGRFAVLVDPTGGTLAAIQLSGPPMRDLDKAPLPGMVAWNELVTPDTEKAGAFWAAVFGWKLEPAPMADGTRYDVFKRGDAMEAGLMKPPAGVPVTQGVWMTYFNVEDADATTNKARELGAKVLRAPFDVPDVGRIAVLSDPQGAVFALFRPQMK
jgi:predicted enzyme related to lactoylglutathione lyase